MESESLTAYCGYYHTFNIPSIPSPFYLNFTAQIIKYIYSRKLQPGTTMILEEKKNREKKVVVVVVFIK